MPPGRIARAVVALAAAATFVACSPSARPATVIAVAHDRDGRPLAGLNVRLVVDLADSTVQARTDSAGRVRLRVPAGGSGLIGFSADSAGDYGAWAWAALLLTSGTQEFNVLLGPAMPRPELRRARGDPESARWGRILDQIRAVQARQNDAYLGAVAAGASAPPALDLGAWPDTLRIIATSDPGEEVRAAAWLALALSGFVSGQLADPVYDTVLAGIPATALVWARRPLDLLKVPTFARLAEGAGGSRAPTRAAQDAEAAAGRETLASRRADEYLRRVAEENPDADARAWALDERVALARGSGRQAEAVALFQQLRTDYPESSAYRHAAAAPPGEALDEGSPVPAVAFPPLSADADPIRPERFAGKVWLVDFWATWCVPCVAQVPVLERAYRHFHARGFDILSVSYDEERSDVAAFRRKWPMPWTHAFVGADSIFRGELSRAYDVDVLPHAVLVGRDGRVIAVDQGLRSGALEETLARVMGPPD